MPDALQLMYAAAQTARATGYQFVAETPGIAAEERDLIERYSSPSGPLTESCNFARATLIYALPTGRVAVSRMANIGRGYDGRPNGICTHTAILEGADYSIMGGRLAWIPSTLVPAPEARGPLAKLGIPDPAAFPPIRFDALPAWMESPATAGLALRALLTRRRLVLIESSSTEDRLDALEALLALLPPPFQRSLTLSTFDVQSNPDRQFSLSVLPESATLGEGGSEGVTVAHLGRAEPVQLQPSPYADFVVGCVYGGDLGPLRAFQRFIVGLETTTASWDQLLAYWQRLETPPTTEDSVQLVALDLDLAAMALIVAPDRAVLHVQHAAARVTPEVGAGLLGRALFRILPFCNLPGGDDAMRRLAGRFIGPVVERKNLAPLCSVLAEAASVAAHPTAPTQVMIFEDVLRATLDVASSPQALPNRLLDRVMDLNAVLKALEDSPGTGSLQAQVALAMAGLPAASDRDLMKLVATRLFRLAEQSSAAPYADRLFQVTSGLRHQTDEVVEEVRSEARRITLHLQSEPTWNSSPLQITLSQLIGLPTSDPGVASNSGVGPLETPATNLKEPVGAGVVSPSPGDHRLPDTGRVFRAISARVEEPPAQVRGAIEAFVHTHDHSPADLPQVIRILAIAFRKAGRPAEALLFLALLPPQELVGGSGTNAGILPTIQEGLLQFSACGKPGQVSPTVALWAVGSLLIQSSNGSWPTSPRLMEQMEGRLAMLAETAIPSPPLTLWDAVVIAGLSPRFVGTSPPDLKRWIDSLSANDRPSLGASPTELRTGLAATRTLLESLKAANSTTLADPMPGGVPKKTRSSGHQRALRQLALLEREIDRATSGRLG
jgi:GTPase-associated protein 1, N-terminal domain type 2